jgi:hypothetical protein
LSMMGVPTVSYLLCLLAVMLNYLFIEPAAFLLPVCKPQI